MARRKPHDLHDSILSDRAMMEEVLELLGPESMSSDQAKKSPATFNNNRDAACNEATNKNELLDCDEEVYPTKQEQELPLDQAQPMRSLMPSTPMQLTEAASKKPSLLPQQLVHGAVPQSFAADPCFVNFAVAPESRQNLPAPVQEHTMVREMITSASIPISPPASILHQVSQDSQPLSKVTHLNSESNVLPTGQRIRVINPDEFEDLRRKVQMQTASRRYRKRKKAS
ncbi:unnamed protein product [Peronospora destructor]|uniref:BZIP domain-containing protein n=1 Tax=Peronospora destructor TaxID=86335 RepID=A0AAV0U5Y4_9STRA|nr:unnamed protein product [Peronospora destructor]